jgi:hypothetical protein
MTDNQTQGDLSAADCAEYQKKTVNLRFMGQFTGALTGATFLGVLGVIGKAFIEVHAATAVAGGAAGAASLGTWFAAAAAGIYWPVAIGFLAVGLACAYLSTSYYQQASILDSDFNARKIASATGKAKTSPETETAVAMEDEPGKDKPKAFVGLVPQNSAEASKSEAGDIVENADVAPEKKWAEKLSPANQNAANWADKLQASASADAPLNQRA